MKMRTKLAFGASTLALLIIAGCGGSGTSNPADQLADPTVRFFNASPDTTGLKFFYNNEQLASNLNYFESTPDFQSVDFVLEEDGAIDFSVSDAGTGEELQRDNQVFNRDTHTLIVAIGKQNPGLEFAKGLQQLLIPVDRRPVQGKSRLYILNALVQGQDIENRPITFRTVDPADPLTNNTALFSKSNLEYGAFNANASVLDIDSGTRTFQARASDVDAVVVFAQKTFVFESGKIYFALVGGQMDATATDRQPKIEFFPLSSIN
ncbi:MAG: DUF4397 domain-containing protein [Armatimonadetes bacterium]|nr:DUF4397 domain-containing protein [Armatimonadota bacterium]